MRCPPVDLRDHVTKWANNKHAELDYKKTTTFNPPIYFNHTHMTHFPSNTQSGINWLGTMELYRNLCFHGMIILLHLDPTANGCSDTSFQNVFGIFLVPTGIDCIEVSDLSPPRRGSIIHFWGTSNHLLHSTIGSPKVCWYFSRSQSSFLTKAEQRSLHRSDRGIRRQRTVPDFYPRTTGSSIFSGHFQLVLQKELKEMARAGVVGFKCFLFPSGVDEFPEVTEEEVEASLRELEGTNSVLAVCFKLFNKRKAQKVVPLIASSVNVCSWVMKITHTMKCDGLTPHPIFPQYRLPILWPCANKERACVPMCVCVCDLFVPCLVMLSLSKSHRHLSQTSYRELHPPELQIVGNLWVQDRGCRMDVVTVSTQIVWWLPELYQRPGVGVGIDSLHPSPPPTFHSVSHPQKSLLHNPRRWSWPYSLMETS